MNGKLKLLKLIKSRNYLKRYAYVFNSNINITKILMLTDNEANNIIDRCFTDSKFLIKMYEIFNNVSIDEYIKSDLFNVSDEVLKYSFNIIKSKIIDDKKQYIKSFVKGEKGSLKYGDYLAKQEKIVKHEYGFNIVNNVLINERNISVYLRDIFTMNEVLNNPNFKELFSLIINIKNEEKLGYVKRLLHDKSIVESRELINYIKLINEASDNIELKNIYYSIVYKDNSYIKENDKNNKRVLDAINNKDIDEIEKYLSVKIKKKNN